MQRGKCSRRRNFTCLHRQACSRCDPNGGLACDAEGMVLMVRVSVDAGGPGWPSSSGEMSSRAFTHIAEAPALFLCLALTSGLKDAYGPKSSSSCCQVYLSSLLSQSLLQLKLWNKYRVSNIPSLIFIDASTGKVVCRNGLLVIRDDPEGKAWGSPCHRNMGTQLAFHFSSFELPWGAWGRKQTTVVILN